MKKIIINFKPDKNGLTKVLGTLEKEVMCVVWRRQKCSGREIYEEIKNTNDFAYTTVLTIISRLVKKGFIVKDKIRNLFEFAPAFTIKEFNDFVSNKVIAGLMNMSSESTIANFVDILSEFDDKKIRELHKIIKDKMEESQETEKR